MPVINVRAILGILHHMYQNILCVCVCVCVCVCAHVWCCMYMCTQCVVCTHMYICGWIHIRTIYKNSTQVSWLSKLTKEKQLTRLYNCKHLSVIIYKYKALMIQCDLITLHESLINMTILMECAPLVTFFVMYKNVDRTYKQHRFTRNDTDTWSLAY